jgi:hypothetical protein
VTSIRRFLPAIASTPRRAAISAVLIAGLAAGPLAGHTGTHATTPTADPVLAAVIGTTPEPAQPAAATASSARKDTSSGVVAPVNAAPSGVPASAAPSSAAPSSAAPSSAAPSSTAPSSAAPGAQATSTAPSQADLMPDGVPTGQSFIALSADQTNNAQAIIKATKEMNLPPRAAVIAVATSLQETKLTNLGNLGGANDHDSLGLFQQRPSTGWGTPDQLTNPDYAAKAFLGALIQIPGWQTMPLTDAAQAVQVSAFGGAYAQWEQQAANLVHDNWNK